MPAPTLEISEARKHFNSIDERLRSDRVIVVTRHNKKVFAVVDYDYLSAVLETMEILADPNAMQLLQESLDDIRAGNVQDHDDVEKELL